MRDLDLGHGFEVYYVPSMTTAAEPTTSPAEVVTTMLEALQDGDVDKALDLLAEDAAWINVSLPTVRQKRRIERILRGLDGSSYFRVHFHNVAEHGDVVLTERTDALGIGRFEQRFWVYGRFEVRNGKITVWRDSFDWGDILVSLVRAVLGLAAPGLNRPWPGD
ncbi:MAG TPA: limonene-1,2-epoxide hydrolase family protein [Solirubrobacterales bacterium]|nr:limonene-1,2-epoxide hydrolase family protein [Solirubrobacterales bacterium]